MTQHKATLNQPDSETTEMLGGTNFTALTSLISSKLSKSGVAKKRQVKFSLTKKNAYCQLITVLPTQFPQEDFQGISKSFQENEGSC